MNINYNKKNKKIEFSIKKKKIVNLKNKKLEYKNGKYSIKN